MNLSEKLKSILKSRNFQYGIGIFFIGFLVWFSFKPKKVSAELAKSNTEVWKLEKIMNTAQEDSEKISEIIQRASHIIRET
jgi:hypothetical protein